jgi:hypothetical protein
MDLNSDLLLIKENIGYIDQSIINYFFDINKKGLQKIDFSYNNYYEKYYNVLSFLLNISSNILDSKNIKFNENV